MGDEDVEASDKCERLVLDYSSIYFKRIYDNSKNSNV